VVVTDPLGIAQVVGGTLNDPGGGVYGAFQVSTVSGAYSMTLTWSALVTVKPITTPAGGGPRTFNAVFYDQGGRSTTKSFTIQLQCDSPYQNDEICAGSCFNSQSDPNNCGTCGHACAPIHAQFVCIGGTCQCPTGTTQCGSICADLQADNQNCGSCGRSCAQIDAGATFTCNAGQCTTTVQSFSDVTCSATCSSQGLSCAAGSQAGYYLNNCGSGFFAVDCNTAPPAICPGGSGAFYAEYCACAG
jgi:hypothetical protein